MPYLLLRLVRVLMLVFVTACSCSSLVAGSELIVRIDDVSHTTGRYLTGIHFDYAEERDSIYRDDRIAKWARKAGITVARFPGGNEVNYWDWRNPTGYKKRDFWDEPGLEGAPPSDWMSLDEYLHFVNVSGVAPLIGINLLSGVRNDRVEDSVVRAKEQVEYIVSKGYAGAFYYLGNEDTSDMGGLEQAARIFVKHAEAIKRVDPNAKLFWNDNAVTKARLRKFLSVAGRYADGVEFHGKWPYGDGKLTRRVSVADWQQHFPFSVEKRGRYSEKALQLRRYAVELGYPNLMFANNEYGLAQFTKERFIDFDRYDYALVAIEFLQDLFIGQFDMAAFYSNVLADRPRGGARAERRLINTEFGNRLNPFHLGLEILSSAQGKPLIRIEGGGPDGYGFGVFSDGQLEVFLLNKSSADNSVNLDILGKVKFRRAGRMFSLVDTVDHWGELVETTIDTDGSSLNVILPSLSYSKIVLAID